MDEILDEIHERETKFKGYRHDGSKSDRFRSTSVLVLCGICAKYIKMKRIGKETFASSLP